MFLKLLKDYLIKKNVKKKSSYCIIKSNKIAILIESDNTNEFCEIQNWFKNDVFKNFEVSFLIFNSNSLNQNTEFITKNSFDWKGKIIDPQITKLITKKYFLSLVISKDNAYLYNIASNIKAQYKFGFNATKIEIFDVSLNLTIPFTEGDKLELLKYLKSFNIIK